jgi:hypothetical protein
LESVSLTTLTPTTTSTSQATSGSNPFSTLSYVLLHFSLSLSPFHFTSETTLVSFFFPPHPTPPHPITPFHSTH